MNPQARMKDETKRNERDERINMMIGQAISKLVKRHGGTTIGMYILEQALLKATGADRLYFHMDGEDGLVQDPRLILHQTPGYKIADRAHVLLLQRLGDKPAAACPLCGGWSSSGGCGQHYMSEEPVEGRTGCGYAHQFLPKAEVKA